MKKILITIFTCAIILLGVGLSYAYFTGNILGENKELLIGSKNVRILFTDSREIANNGIKPGWNDSKTFSVKNESNDNFNYNIVFENLVNTFVTEGFLQYKITSSNGYNMEGYLDIPKSSSPKTVVLAYDIDLPKDTTHEYIIEFVYHNSETIDQSDDMGKVFEGNLAIIEGAANPNIKYTVTMNSDNGTITPTSNQAIKYENLEFEVTPDTGFDINTMSVSCDPVANTVITDNKIRVNDIRQDHNCEVSFDKETYTVNIVVNNGESDALNKVVEYGGSGTAKITPDKGYTLENATVEGTGCSIEGEVLSISNVVSNGTCTVTLPREKYTVTLTGTGIQESDSPKTVEYEGETTINFTLSEGYELGSNVINCDNGEPSISGNVLTVSNVTANTTCTLSPVLKSYDVTLVVNGGTPTSETKSVTYNGSTTYTIANSTGYKLELNGSINCTGNATGSLSGSTVTISGVTAVQTCTVNLKKQTYSINVSSNNTSYGIVSPSSSTVNHGDNLEVTITPASGYKYSSNDCGLTPSNNKITFSNITSNKSCTVTFEKDIKTLSDTIKKAYTNSGERSDFSSTYTTTKLHTATDYDSSGSFNGTTYYFTGNPNNWVKFADKCWRIIRINGNGSVRLLYAGTGGEDGYIGSSQGYNTSANHPSYVGWKYTKGNSLSVSRRNETKSEAYNKVETWYSGLSAIDKNYIDTNAIYCNDRGDDSGYSIYHSFSYVAKIRLFNNSIKSPTFKCSDSEDKFYDFGLMTADEVAYAGGVNGVNNQSAYYYLNKDGGSSIGSNWWWTMTPYYYDYLSAKNSGYASVFIVYGSTSPGRLNTSEVSPEIISSRSFPVIRPVVSLKKEVLVIGGNGSASSPYELSL